MSPSKELKDDLRKLEATAREFAGIEADAARWRWLRAEHERSDPLAAVVWKQGGNRNGGEWVNTTSLDREVDSAIADMEVRCGRGCSCCTQCGDWYELHNRPKPKE